MQSWMHMGRLLVVRRAIAAGLVVATAALVAGGVATAAPARTTASSAARLTSKQWSTYQTADKKWLSVNSKGIKRFRKCSAAQAANNASADKMSQCLGKTIPKVMASNKTFGVTLHSFQKTVRGKCASALNAYIGGLFSWNNVVAGIGHAISLGQAPNTANAQTAYNQITTAAKAFVKACKPVG
jgi:hypothetical protein